MKKESLKIWQPETNLVANVPTEFVLKEMIKHEDYFKLVVEDYEDNITEIIYDQLNGPMEYYVWSFRYSTEIGRFGIYYSDVDEMNLKNKGNGYFFKVINSEYIKWFDNQNPLFNSETHPNLEHFAFITRDEVVEVLCDYEPRIYFKK